MTEEEKEDEKLAMAIVLSIAFQVNGKMVLSRK